MFPFDPNPAETNAPGFDVGETHEPENVAPAPRLGPWAKRFEELQVDLGADTVEFTRVRSNTHSQTIALFGSALAFTAFVAIVMPLMHLSSLGNALWLIAAMAVLALIAMVMHARVQTTKIKLDRVGLTIDDGTEMDRETIVVLWAELAGVDLEPVNETDTRKGMCLRLRPREGEPIDTFAGLGVGELNDVRRVINETLARHREHPTRGG